MSYPNSIYQIIDALIKKGLTINEAWKEVEYKLKGPVPEELKDRVKTEMNYHWDKR